MEKNIIVNTLIMGSKKSYFKDTLDNANTKTIYKTLTTLLNTNARKLPSCSSDRHLSNRFARHFTEKVADVRRELDQDHGDLDTVYTDGISDPPLATTGLSRVSYNDHTTHHIDYLSHVSEEEVAMIIAKLPVKHSIATLGPHWAPHGYTILKYRISKYWF